MSAAVLPSRIAETSPRTKARIAGFFYLLVFVIGGLSLFRDRLVVAGDPATTAANLLAHDTLFQLGFTADLIVDASYLVVTALFYELFRPASRSLSLVAAFFSLVGCATLAFACLFHRLPLAVVRGAPQLSGLNVGQLRALALRSFQLYGEIYKISFVFFGFYCLLIGALILRSTFLPRFLGLLMTFAGLGWLTFLYPTLANSLYPYVLLPGILGEGALTLWLLIAGVNAQRWEEQAGAAVSLKT